MIFLNWISNNWTDILVCFGISAAVVLPMFLSIFASGGFPYYDNPNSIRHYHPFKEALEDKWKQIKDDFNRPHYGPWGM